MSAGERVNHRKRGFTLVELLVAIAIFLLFMGTVYATYRGAITSITRTEEREETYQTARVLLSRMNAELCCAYQTASATVSCLTGEDAGASDETQNQSNRLTFLTMAHQPCAADGPTGDVCQVSYYVQSDADGQPMGLYCEEVLRPGLEVTDEAPAPVLLSDLIVDLNCQYLDGTSDEWLDEWVDQTALPKAVRVELTVKPKRENAKPIMMASTANITFSPPPPETEQTGGSEQTGGGSQTGDGGQAGGGGQTGGGGQMGGGGVNGR